MRDVLTLLRHTSGYEVHACTTNIATPERKVRRYQPRRRVKPNLTEGCIKLVGY